MGKKEGKMLLLAGVLCTLGIAVCACGKAEEASDEREWQVVSGEPIPKEDTKSDASDSEPEASTEETNTGDGQNPREAETGPGENRNEGADSVQTEQAEAQSTPTGWADSEPNLVGDVKDLKEGQLTVVEAIMEKADNGGDIMVSPAEGGDDSKFNKVAVTYDENTLFAIQMIYDGGARFEMLEATAADLASGQLIHVWGSPSGSGLKASQICIVKVA